MNQHPTSNPSPPAQVTLFDVGEPHLPVLPYGLTSGWSGSETSKERVLRADMNGTTGLRQRRVWQMLEIAGKKGLTWAEINVQNDWHHGVISGALSAMHKAGVIERLAERRHRCAVYVLPQFVDGRETHGYQPNLSAKLLVAVLEELEADLEQGHLSTALARVRATRRALQ